MPTMVGNREFAENMLAGKVAAATALKLYLATSAVAPTNEMRFISDFTGAGGTQVTGTGYTAGGLPIDNPAVSRSGGSVKLDFDDEVINQDGGGFTNARYCLLYDDTGTPGTSEIWAHADFGSDKGNVSGPLTLSPSAANGAILITVT